MNNGRRLFVYVRRLIYISLALLFTASSASALCAAQDEAGSWDNTNGNTRSITQLNIRFVCQDVVLNGELHPPGPPFHMHLFGSCSPTDCDWGETGARRLSSGLIYGFYDQGFAKRHVYARMSEFRAGQLWLHIYTDYVDPDRADRRSNNWFRRR